MQPAMGNVARRAVEIVPVMRQEQSYAAQEERELGAQADALTRLGGLPALEQPALFGDRRQFQNVLAANLVANLFDPSGQAGREIAEGYTKGRLMEVDRQIQNQRIQRAQQTQKGQADAQAAGLRADLAGTRRREARGERIRIEDRNAKLAADQREERYRQGLENERNLDRALGRYNQASTYQEKIEAGRNLQRLQRLNQAEPITDEQIASEAAAIKSGRLEKAQRAARLVYEPDLKLFGHIAENAAPDYEKQIQAIADEYQIPREQLPQVPTFETLAKQRFDFHKKDVDRKFKHLKEKDRTLLAQAQSRVEIAQAALRQAAERIAVSRDVATIAAYNAATNRYRAELQAARGQMAGLESGTLGKLNHDIAMKQALLDAAIQNEDDEKEVELRAQLGVLLSEQEAIQEKLLQGLGVDPGFLTHLGNLPGMDPGRVRQAAIDAGAANRPKPQVPPGPQVGGASSKMLRTPDGRTFSVQDAYEAAKRAIAANPGQKKAIIARYESLPGNPKWPG